MSADNAEPNRAGRIVAVFAMALALGGGYWLFNKVNDDTPPAIATSCSGFETDAQKLFDKGDTGALRGTFAPGDHVHLTIDLNGGGYSWELFGVLQKKGVTGSGSVPSINKRTISITTSNVLTISTIFKPPRSFGELSGFARLEVEIDVTKAGDGAIAFKKAGTAPSSTPLPKVVNASCGAPRQDKIKSIHTS